MTAGHNTFVRGDLFASQGKGNNLLFSEDNQMIMESIDGDGQSAMSNNAYYTDGNMIGANYPTGSGPASSCCSITTRPPSTCGSTAPRSRTCTRRSGSIDAYDYLRFGFEKYAGPASELWYDDIAIGTQPIGCN